MNNLEILRIRAVIGVLEGEARGQIRHLLVQRPAVERYCYLPVGVLRVPVGGLQRQDNGLTRPGEPADALRALRALDRSGLLPLVQVGDIALDILEDRTAGPRRTPARFFAGLIVDTRCRAAWRARSTSGVIGSSPPRKAGISWKEP